MAVFSPATGAPGGAFSVSKTLESSPFAPVQPVRPLAAYVGGKRNLSARLIARIATIPHDAYAEPFVGMGGVFFRRDRRPGREMINDLSGDVANLFRVLQEHYPALVDELRFKLSSRHEFDRLMRQAPDTLTDLRRAARFIYVQKLAFGGRVAERHFGNDWNAPARFDVSKVMPMLQDVHDRLSGVLIEQLPFDRFIARYDRAGTLFYCDPPYWGTEDYYGAALFQRSDFESLSASLQSIKGRFLLSLNDVPEIRDIFGWATIEAVEVNYYLSGKPTPAREVIISGGAGLMP